MVNKICEGKNSQEAFVQVQGIAGQAQESSYTDKKSNQQIRQWRFDVLDDIAGTMPIQMDITETPPQRGVDVIVDVAKIRTIPIGVGYVLVAKGWRPNNGSSSSAAAVPKTSPR